MDCAPAPVTCDVSEEMMPAVWSPGDAFVGMSSVTGR